jgi:hypothetical protein
VAINLLDELYNPKQFLASIHERLNAGGILILGSAYDWEKNKIKRENWPGAFKQDGEPVTSFEGIKALLQDNFELVEERQNLPAAKILSSRNVEVSVVEISVWKKR